MSSTYRALFRRAEARSVALSCGLGWLSFAGYGLAIVLAVEAATGSFAVAGATVAAFSAGSALLAPLRGSSSIAGDRERSAGSPRFMPLPCYF